MYQPGADQFQRKQSLYVTENYETLNIWSLLFVYKLEKLVNTHFISGSKSV
jgi:hypothetical protein